MHVRRMCSENVWELFETWVQGRGGSIVTPDVIRCHVSSKISLYRQCPTAAKPQPSLCASVLQVLERHWSTHESHCKLYRSSFVRQPPFKAHYASVG